MPWKRESDKDKDKDSNTDRGSLSETMIQLQHSENVRDVGISESMKEEQEEEEKKKEENNIFEVKEKEDLLL